MATTPWFLQIVHVSSAEKQQDLLRLLREVAGVTALGSSDGIEHFVVFECPDLRLKVAVERLFADIDPASKLLHVTRQPLQPGGGGVA